MLWLLAKSRQPGVPTGKLEGRVKNVVLHKKAAGAKARPGTKGSAVGQAPKLGKISSGGSKLGSVMGAKKKNPFTPKSRPSEHGWQSKLAHNDFAPGFFKKNLYVEFEMHDGTKGQGRVRDFGPKGCQLHCDDGKIRHTFYHEIKGKVKEEAKNGKTKK